MVTAQQIQTAFNITSQIGEVVEQLRQTIQFALDQTVVGVPLDATVITALQNQYSTLKTRLQALTGSLP